MFLISYMILLICVLFSVAFMTLMERKVLGYIQLRKGPNKIGMLGILQPFSDGMKLFFKEKSNPGYSNFYIYYFSPVFMLTLSFLLWLIFPFMVNIYNFDLGILFFLCCLGLSVYGVLLSGWSSNSNYALLGSLRSLAQSISYEVSMSMILICFLIFLSSFNLLNFMIFQEYVWFIFISFPIFLCWFGCCLAETNRSPFDFAEGESELVSGFNVEYSSGSFAFIFLSEYMNIIFLSLMTVIIFLGCDLKSLMFFLKIVILMFMFIWIRGTLPRYRYDKLMYLSWKIFLPISLYYLMFFSGFMMM